MTTDRQMYDLELAYEKKFGEPFPSFYVKDREERATAIREAIKSGKEFQEPALKKGTVH
jgi:hypothetical protein